MCFILYNKYIFHLFSTKRENKVYREHKLRFSFKSHFNTFIINRSLINWVVFPFWDTHFCVKVSYVESVVAVIVYAQWYLFKIEPFKSQPRFPQVQPMHSNDTLLFPLLRVKNIFKFSSSKVEFYEVCSRIILNTSFQFW